MKFRDEIIRGMVREELSRMNEDIDLSQFPNPGKYKSNWLSKGKRDGSAKDDVVKTKKATIPASKLKPSQSEIFLSKSVGMAIGNMVGGDIGAVISKDNHILDGHHRWAATTLNNPKAKIGGIQAELPIKQLIPILRAAGDALGNARRGMPDGGDVNIFKATIEDIRAACYDGKNMDMQYYNKEKSIAWFEKIGEAELKKRLKMIQAKEPKNAPNRPNMPVIDAKKGEDSLIMKLFNSGEIDVKKPYAKESVQHPLKEGSTRQVEGDIIKAIQLSGYGSMGRNAPDWHRKLERETQSNLLNSIKGGLISNKFIVSKISNIKANSPNDGEFTMTADVVLVFPDRDEEVVKKLDFKYSVRKRINRLTLENVNSNGTHPLKENYERLFERKDKRLIKESFSGDLVLRQLGGNRFIAMTGAKNFVQSKADRYLAFKLPSNFAYEGINYVKVQLNSLDLYDVTFSKIRGTSIKEISRAEGIYGDMLAQIFRKHTKLNTRL